MPDVEAQVNKTIYISEAACGTGKTESLVRNFGRFLGKRVLIASPTIELCNDIERRLKESQTGLNIKAVHSEMSEGATVQAIVTTQMTPKFADIPPIKMKSCHQVLIITTPTFETLDPSYLKGWVVIIDELPKVECLEDWPISTASVQSLDNYIRVDQETKKVELLVKGDTYKEVVESTDSALGKAAKKFLTSVKNSPTGTYLDSIKGKNTHYRTAYFKDNIKALLEASKEVHVLGANFSNTFFRIALKHWGFTLDYSHLSPENTEHINTHHVELIQLLPNNTDLSKYRLALKYDNDEMVLTRLLKIANGILKRDYITVVNKVVSNKTSPYLESSELNIKRINYDPRGMNTHIDSTQIVLLAVCNPSPIQSNNLKFLADHIGADTEVLKRCWEVSYYTEMVYQQASRTGVRKRDNIDPIRIVVGDTRALDYLKAQFPEATVNTDHIIKLPVKPPEKDGRRTVKASDKRRTSSAKKQRVAHLLHEGKTYKDIKLETGCSNKVIKKIKDDLQSFPISSKKIP